VIILLVAVGDYSTSGYWWLLVAIVDYSIGGYFINDYWWLFH
jgi:hypothetical protein